ncbi:flavin reductase family protein [Actinoplanes sp. NPDC051851]|uniref:flavin reductase family protein n=1 Tax=Actinoplanes sp. NPDC051851 TaxID=3154753 RepID=UPI003444B90A
MISDIDTDLGDQLKAAFRRYPTGVAVISANGPAGPAGLTASSVASVSVAPPALSFSLLSTASARAVLDAPTFVVNLLGPDDADLARDFAHSSGPRFTPEQGWGTLPTGEPFLPAALASLRCSAMHRLPVGDATVIVGAVLGVHLGSASGHLIHHNRRFLPFHQTPSPVRPEPGAA